MTSKPKVDGKEVKGEYLLREPYARTLRKWRILRGFNQAKLVLEAKVPKHVVGSLERCERPIDLEEIVKLCHALKIDPNRFLDEVHSLVQRAIEPLDESVRAARVKEGLEELPSGDQELRKALDLVAEKWKQHFMFMELRANRGLLQAEAEPERGGGRKRSKPAR